MHVKTAEKAINVKSRSPEKIKPFFGRPEAEVHRTAEVGIFPIVSLRAYTVAFLKLQISCYRIDAFPNFFHYPADCWVVEYLKLKGFLSGLLQKVEVRNKEMQKKEAIRSQQLTASCQAELDVLLSSEKIEAVVGYDDGVKSACEGKPSHIHGNIATDVVSFEFGLLKHGQGVINTCYRSARVRQDIAEPAGTTGDFENTSGGRKMLPVERQIFKKIAHFQFIEITVVGVVERQKDIFRLIIVVVIDFHRPYVQASPKRRKNGK